MLTANTTKGRSMSESRDRHWPISPTLKERLLARLLPVESGCWEWQGYVRPKGYGQIGNGNKKVIDIHRASWLVHNGRIPEGMWILHHCDNRICGNPEHLYLGTVVENVRDMHARNRDRKAQGIEASNGRLTTEQVEEIRRRYVKGETLGRGYR
jgi:hypothetical protein